mgnify:CR=1 FL=1
MTTNLLKQGIAALNAGQKAEARNLLMQVVQQDEHNEMGWLWLSGAVDTDEERRVCLENVLAINPNNGVARRGLESLIAKKGARSLGAVSAPVTEAESPRRKLVTRPVAEAREGIKPEPRTTPRPRPEKKKVSPVWKWALLGGGGTALLLLVGCLLAYVLGAIPLPSSLELGKSGTATSEHNPVPGLVRTCLPTGYKYVSDYVTTGGGDTVWVVEVTEPESPMTLGEFSVFFREFAETVDTSDVAWLKLSIVKSEAWMPYAHCVRSGPARAAARGEITAEDLFMQFDYCP